MTTYQAEPFLAEQLASIEAQHRPPDQVVVVDDASSDATWEILTAAADRSSLSFVLHRQEVNVGLRRNVERALRECTGNVVVLADQDDLWDPAKLTAVDAAFRDPTTALWFSDADLVDQRGASLGRRVWEAVHLDESTAATLGWQRLLHGMTVTGATMAVSSRVVDLALPLPEALDGPGHLYLHDGWLAVLASACGRVVAEPRPLTSYRQHAAQVTDMEMARQPLTPDEGRTSDVRLLLGRRDALRADRDRLALVTGRLRDSGTWGECDPSVTAAIADLERFLDVRAGRAESRLGRSNVLRELARGGYRRHARGSWTALRDLL